jgi:hypothetical protein
MGLYLHVPPPQKSFFKAATVCNIPDQAHRFRPSFQGLTSITPWQANCSHGTGESHWARTLRGAK